MTNDNNESQKISPYAEILATQGVILVLCVLGMICIKDNDALVKLCNEVLIIDIVSFFIGLFLKLTMSGKSESKEAPKTEKPKKPDSSEVAEIIEPKKKEHKSEKESKGEITKKLSIATPQAHTPVTPAKAPEPESEPEPTPVVPQFSQETLDAFADFFDMDDEEE